MSNKGQLTIEDVERLLVRMLEENIEKTGINVSAGVGFFLDMEDDLFVGWWSGLLPGLSCIGNEDGERKIFNRAV